MSNVWPQQLMHHNLIQNVWQTAEATFIMLCALQGILLEVIVNQPLNLYQIDTDSSYYYCHKSIVRIASRFSQYLSKVNC